jgi:lipoate-protein ligase A
MAPQPASANCQSKNPQSHVDIRFLRWLPWGMLFHTLELLHTEPLTPFGAALNMAVDEVLLLQAHRPVLRVYKWARPAVSFGYFESWQAVNAAYPPPAWELVRRWTGGGVVVHGQDWTYSLIVPRSDPFALVKARESYLAVHRLLADALSLAGLGGCEGRGVSLVPEAAAKVSQACFENPAQHDLLLAGRKVAGAGQRRSRAGMLHQGSVQGVTLPRLFADQWARSLAATVIERRLDESELAEARSLAEEKYATAEWNQRK